MISRETIADTFSQFKHHLTPKVRLWLTRGLIAFLIILIITIYYMSEKRPFPYSGYDQNISQLQRLDAELNEAIVQTRFGIVKNYNPIDMAIKGEHDIYNALHASALEYPNPIIDNALQKLSTDLTLKQNLSDEFKRINPVMINAINQFSQIIYTIIDLQKSDEAIESGLGGGLEDQYAQQEKYQMMDNISNLFQGILTYINLRSDEKHQKLVDLVKTIRNDPLSKNTQKYPKLEYALNYADQILQLQPELNTIVTQIFDVPIATSIGALNESYRASYTHYLKSASIYRIILYIMLFVVLVLLRWTFSRIRRTVSELHIEVQRKVRAEKELELINRQLEQRIAERTKELVLKNTDLNSALANLKEAQDQLIIQEKMASVGMLTTGIAHEIKNPLNFVNNFSAISVELISELEAELEANKDKWDPKSLEYINEILSDLKTNSAKIKEHGERADNIVKNMLLHSQEAGVQKDVIDLKPLVDDNTQIAIQSFSERQGKFDVTVQKNYAEKCGKVLAAPQAIARVIAYVVDNAVYAMREKQKSQPEGYTPVLQVSMTQEDNKIVMKFRDNGTGIPKKALDKVFEPFYTTKPTGKGNTGLGLSICYDTVVKQHKGELRVNSVEGEYTEFVVSLPVSEVTSQNQG